MNLSIIIPVFNESKSLLTLVKEISAIVIKNKIITEILFINDGSTDNSWDIITSVCKKHNKYLIVKGIGFKINTGKSAALNIGFIHSQGSVVMTMDGDLQDDPKEIPNFYDAIVLDGYDLVSGWKKKRNDPLSKTIPTKLYNWATRFFSGINLHDFNCGFKSYKQNVVKNIEVSGEMHRYIPLLVKQKGFNRIGELIVNHRSRKHGKSKYGIERFSNGLLDLVTIIFLNKFGKRPMHFFGFFGIISFIIGFTISFYLAYAKLFYEQYNMTDRPIFYLSLLCMIIGSQLFLAGFIGEMIVRKKKNQNESMIEKIGF